jgi:phosphoglucosamine mutase
LRLTAGIVISASHNPYYDNGIKFFSAQGTKLPDEIELKIEQAIDQPMHWVKSESLGRARRLADSAGRYIEFCKSAFPNDLNLNGLKIVVDAAHGAAYNIAPHVFRELGAEVIAVGVQPDGFNINQEVGATYPEKLAEEVRKHGADLGIALDGDADRLQMVDSQGRIYNGDELLYLIVADHLQSQPVKGVVGTLMTNLGFEKKMQELGVEFARAKVGDRYVLELMQQKGWVFGGESSGHLLCLEWHTTGDGIIAALQVLTALCHSGKSLPDLMEGLKMYPQIMVNVPLQPGQDWKNHAGLQQATQEVEKMLGDRGRVLIRASGTEPKLRLMVEAEQADLAQAGIDTLLAVDLMK